MGISYGKPGEEDTPHQKYLQYQECTRSPTCSQKVRDEEAPHDPPKGPADPNEADVGARTSTQFHR
ncbi:hypothetical protein HS1genome_1668 [Sulfodiicoccus acidiphilus]|uniref:Uncharacterized protein n=1 Tax=Sulfodiicoccus acidiphilus TaxID=1670455 RepID=A0A348B527_9CREN|nr:hypothetical protein HS1genome_1668 [Sulfodiicoccus acidiphilus]GGT89410.1 hypothetical protein GCM10007116_04070 [Sulfodiicoccus acidiphilus]